MEIWLESVYVAFSIWLLKCLLIELKRSRHSCEIQMNDNRIFGEVKVFSIITVLCNVLICVSYLSFGFYEYWKLRIISLNTVCLAMTWALAAVVSFCSRKYRTLSETKRWPSVLILWWVVSLIIELLSVYVITHLRSIELPHLLPEPNVVDFVALPLLILLCFIALPISCTRNSNDLEDPSLLEENEYSSKKASTFTNAGFWSKLTFTWLNHLFEWGRTRKLELPHIPSIPRSEKAQDALLLLEELLRKQKMEASSLTKVILYGVWKSLAVNAAFAGIHTIASFIGPFFITNFVNFLSEKHGDSSYHYGLTLACIFFIAKTVESSTQRQRNFGAHRMGIRVRSALTALIYKKSLSMKFAGLSSGVVINMINEDVEKIGDFCCSIHGIWLLPVQVFLAFVILYRNLGAAPAFVSLFFTISVMVSSISLARMKERFHSDMTKAKDSRIKETSETLKSMRVITLLPWEQTLLMKILQHREIEILSLKKYQYTCSAIAFLGSASPTLVSVITYWLCILLKTPQTTGRVLSALAIFQILHESIYNLPELISMITKTKVSIDRIQEFIREENQKKAIADSTSNASDIAIEIEAGKYAWNASDQNLKKSTIIFTEKMKIMKGFKVAVCGSVGSGKSSLLCSILGEIPRTSGAGIKVYGRTACVPQSAWIQTGTIRENVLFGKDMNEAFYGEVSDGCALNQDIAMWADGDLCAVGERGMNLSGGRKQRIQLARAVYSDSDIYILDDIFSTVDAHTGMHLFKQCLMGLLSQKTVVYATHQLEFLDAADLVLVMKDGKIVQSGRYEDLIADPKSELVRQMHAHIKSLDQVNPPQEDKYLTMAPWQISQIEVTEERFTRPIGNGKLWERTHEEDTETGQVEWTVYLTFITLVYKGALVPVILLCQLLFQGLKMAGSYWISWATDEKRNVSRKQLIGVFILLSVGSCIFLLGRELLLATCANKTAQRLFHDMITSVFRAPISFFGSITSSRILNMSSTDQSIVDTDIPHKLEELAFALIQLLNIIIIMSLVAWQVLHLFIVVLVISIRYQVYYITTARELVRMVRTQKAPILDHFSESIRGAATIRCFKQEDRFLTKTLSLIDCYARVAFHNYGTMEWLCLRINFLFFLVLIILVTLPRSAIDPSLAALAASYGLNLNVLLESLIVNLCNVENKMISVERILRFTNIPSEAPPVIRNAGPSPEWPTNGKIEVASLHVNYIASLPLVLKGITCTFPGEKKIGIVGRTGSGKSTLIQALFREVKPSGGRILIDEVDISTIGLQYLRSRLSIIPQDPMLFQGTVRANLDPWEQHSDQEIWEVVKKCRLVEIINQDPRRLDAPVAEDGENWSVGQRQLVCLARVLLKKRRILVLDEATASIDTATDNVIQQIIREETSRCTVITVARRIPSVVNNDLVLVLDEGKVLEYDSPGKLLQDNSSSFSKLVEEFSRTPPRSNRSNMDLSFRRD